MKIDLLCKSCRYKIGETERVKYKPFVISRKLCDSCRILAFQKNNENQRLKMLSHNPVRNKSVRNKISETLKEKYISGEIKSPFQDKEKLKIIHEKRKRIGLSAQGIKILSERMSKNNPMFDKGVSSKVGSTIKRKVKSGEIVYKRGHEHCLYKGTRTFSNDCRKWLRLWILSILQKDNFQCSICKKKEGLHVHHLRPLREIIRQILEKNNIKDVSVLKNENVHKYEYLIQQVVNEHKIEDGKSVCKQCHANIDGKYRRVKA